MASLNRVILMGNLTRDPELRYTPSGAVVCDVGLAMNRVWTDDQGQKKEEVCFVDVTCWSKTAENLAQYKKKGEGVLVEGRLVLETWDDKQTGQKRSKLKVVAERLVFLPSGGPHGEGGEAPAQRASRPTARRTPAPAGDPAVQADPPENYDPEVPF